MNTFKVIKKFTTTKLNFPRSAVIVAAKRTPVGTFLGKMSNLKATELGSIAVNSALDSTGLSAEEIRNAIEEVYLGNVCSAGLGQNPARQVSLGAKIPINVPCTTVNKVCSSGLKTVTLGAQSISLGISDAVVTGGFESMSNVPFYITKHRKGHSYGNQEIIDGLALDGLTDIYKGIAMGECGEKTASDFSINRAAQDEFTIASYERALKGMKNGFFDSQIASVFINEKEGTISEDEEPKRFNKEKLLKLRPAFRKEGTITAASSSSFNDGASALVLMSEEKAMKLGLNPLARIVSFADYEMEPIDFCISPSKAIEICINRAGKKIADVDYFEINEAFAVTVLANMKILGLDHQQVNVYGGAVALGHPIGMSGGRILINLINVLKERKAKFGIAGVCNGGGGSTAVLIENI